MDTKTMDRLREIEACPEALEWIKAQPDAQTAWASCHDLEWMLWLLKAVGADNRKLRLFAADCAESVLYLIEERQREVCASTIAVARAYARGEATDDQLAAARDAARDAAWAARDAARDAALAARDTTWDTAWGAARDAAWAAGAAMRTAQRANIRKYFPANTWED